jgi:6-phosphogluconolactonase (cycloisomerase 2 family)
LNGDLLYVLNAGGAVGDSDNITGFRFDAGGLTAIAGSTRSLSASNTGPAQVSFTSGGDVLIATEKSTGIIDTFTVGADGLVESQKMFASPVPTPFGFAAGRKSRIFVSEANAGVADGSSVSSCQVSIDGSLTTISGSIPTEQSAACWVVLTRNERFAYASDTGSGIITGYRVAPDGSLQLLNANGITGVIGAGSAPIDLALSRDSGYFYSLNSRSHSISAFHVNADGSLNPMTGVSGIPASADGLAAQ